jgi:hypothetical protein
MVDRALSFVSRRIRIWAVLAVLLCPAQFAFAALPDEPRIGDAIGAIEGESIAVTGPMSVDVVRGQVKTVLRSGADVRVKSGIARIDLVEGGQITICGPAHFSVLKSGGALTLALDSGIIHAYIEHEPALTIYTAQIKAQPLSIGDSAQDTTAGLDASGAMCIRAGRGAVRLEQQLTGQSVIIPQGGDVQVLNGLLDSLRQAPAHCHCELQLAKLAPPPSAEVSRIATAAEVRRNSQPDLRDSRPTLPSTRAEKPTMKEEPVYQVFVPPLMYDAKAAVQPDVDPRMIVLVRRVRVRPTLIFQGRVEGEVLAAAIPASAPVPPVTPQPSTKKAPPPANDSFVDRFRSFVRRLWSRGGSA